MMTGTNPDGSAPHATDHRRSIAVFRAMLRCYPRSFRDRWAEEVVLLFADLARSQPRGAASTVALWARHLPDVAGGLLAEWWREFDRISLRWPAVTHGVVAGILLSATTVAGNLGQLWATPPGVVGSWLVTAVALTVLASSGRSTGVGPANLRRALRNGFLSGLIAFTTANLTATVVVAACFEHLSHDSLQISAFIASHERDFRTYQMHELLGGWTYGNAVGALVGTLASGAAAAASRFTNRHQGGARI